MLNWSFGRVAQLGERIHGMDEVAGSTPVTSTKFSGSPLILSVGTSPALAKEIPPNTL